MVPSARVSVARPVAFSLASVEGPSAVVTVEALWRLLIVPQAIATSCTAGRMEGPLCTSINQPIVGMPLAILRSVVVELPCPSVFATTLLRLYRMFSVGLAQLPWWMCMGCVLLGASPVIVMDTTSVLAVAL